MSEARTCSQCGAPLAGVVPDGFCPACALQGALDLGFTPAATSSGPAQPETRNPELGTQHPVRFGDYELLDEIARGGMGIVYRARQLGLDRIVALKLILFGQFADEAAVKRFRAESTAAARLQHPNIVAIHEVGEQDGQHFFSMDYIKGKNLADLMREGPVPAKRAAGLLKTIAEAIHYAHGQGIVHRDLKPSNILLDDAGEPRVTDFGLAKRIRGSRDESRESTASDAPAGSRPSAFDSRLDLTLPGQVLGSPNFIAPEQASGKADAVGPCSDIFSLGAILYQLLTGRPPFTAETLTETLNQVLTCDPPAPRLLNPVAPRDLETICLKSLQKNPRQRYADAQDLADELGRFLRDEPIQARPVSRPEKLWRWARRNPRVTGLSTALLAVFLIGFAAVFWQLQRVAASDATSRRHLYAAEMVLAARALAENNLGRAVELLQHHRPRPRRALDPFVPNAGAANDDLRGWEWRHLWRQCRSDELFTLGTHSNCVTVVVTSPDGRHLASASWDKTVKLWNLADRREVATWPHRSVVYGLAWSPDGKWIATSCIDQTVWMWNAVSHRLTYVLTNESPVQSLIFAPDSQLLAGGDHVAVKFWEPSSGRLVWTNAAPHQWMLPRGLAFSPDGRWFAYGNGDTFAVVLWDRQRKVVFTNLAGHTEASHTLGFSPDGRTLASGGYDRTVRIWDLTTFNLVTNLTGFGAWVSCVAFSPRTNLMTTTSADQRLKLWDTRTWKEVATLNGHTNEVWSAAFSPNGASLATGSKDGTIRVWSTAPREEERNSIELPVTSLGTAIVSPDATTVMTVTSTGLVDQVDCVTFADTRTMKELSRASYHWTNWLNVGIPSVFVLAGALSPGGDHLAVSGDDGVIVIWNPKTRRVEATLRGDTNMVRVLRYSMDGTHLAVGRATNTLSVWDLRTTKRIASFPCRKTELMDIAISSDHRLVVVGYGDLMGEVWDVAGRRKLMDLPGHTSRVWVVALSTNGRFAATGGEDAKVKLWDLRDRTEIATLTGQLMAVYSLAFSPDGRRLAGSGADGRVSLWDITAAPPLEVAAFKASEHAITPLIFTPDGDTLFSVGLREGVRAWRAAPWEEIHAAEKAGRR